MLSGMTEAMLCVNGKYAIPQAAAELQAMSA